MDTARRPVRWLVPLALVIVWLGLGGAFGSYAGRLGEVATDDQASFLPRGAESTKVIAAQKAFAQRETMPAVVVWTVPDGGRITSAQQDTATRALASLTGTAGVEGRPSVALPSKDGAALEGVVPLDPSLGERLTGPMGATG